MRCATPTSPETCSQHNRSAEETARTHRGFRARGLVRVREEKTVPATIDAGATALVARQYCTRTSDDARTRTVLRRHGPLDGRTQHGS